jgi:hypothetical protein
MHERFKQRLADLERGLRDSVLPMVSIGFVNPDKTPVEFRVAWSGDFKCWRREGEDEDAFEARAHAEALAADPHGQILIFSDKEISRAS